MYEVVLINNGVETVINAISSNPEAPRIPSGTIKKGINTIDSFNFEIYPQNIGYSKINALTTLVEINNAIKNKKEFRGRVLLSTPKMGSNGNLYISVLCESELGYLNDSTTRYGEYHDISVKDFLKIIIDNHNNMVSEDKRFELGIVEITGNLYRFLGYEKTFAAIKDKLLDRLGGELRVRWSDGKRYLDYLIKIGDKLDTEIRLSKNLKTLEQERDPTTIVSRLTPLGAKLENSDERITIKSVNNGKDYIDDIEAIKEFGLLQDCVVWDDVNVPAILLNKGIEKQKELNRIRKKYKIEALDLALIGLDFNTFEVGNEYPVINPLMGIDEYIRVTEKTITITSPQNSSLMIGDKFEDIKEYNLITNKNTRILENVRSQVNNTVAVVKDVSTELSKTVDIVNNTVQVLETTNKNLSGVSVSIIDINTSLQETIMKTLELMKLTALITEDLNSTNKKVERLKKRVNIGV
ncbi:phage tail spike protein [Clostridium perfringens]|uniref:phage tail spike protein n=1 Tax=Clostridium perfringens TaxID=1502 RepID=UPI001B81F499|nr:phage tail protein [Clostridium perfringens]HBC2034853.1 phage tail protein [Clostridium perfringens]HBC2058001.1 phage tail protein [Clostridium perfringens]HBC2072204.1 phage tail protein [Clostridium perfringens]